MIEWPLQFKNFNLSTNVYLVYAM